ncbi:MAG: Ig-like domain-containing protein, partial [bacterium]|nr:Ig-like domain-containing protein [bacterium]
AMVNYTSSSPTITRSVFSGNSSNKYGGGIRNYSSSPSITNSLFSGNTAATIGGGIYNESSSNPTLINVTLSGNYAGTDGGAIYNNSSDPIIKNSIIWNNKETSSTITTSASIKNSSSSATPNISYSLIANSNGSGGSWDSQYSIDGGSNIDVDPTFTTDLTPTNTASTAGNFRLTGGAPASVINGGTTSGAPSDDLDLFTRIGDPDMGAYELNDTTVPTVTLSPLDGATDVASTSNITITFNEAVQNTDDSALTDSNIDSLITLKETDASGSTIAFDATIDGDKKVVTVNPSSNFSDGQAVYLAIGATFEDQADNAITGTSTSFTIADANAPTVTFSPVNSATDVPVWSNITITFNEAVRNTDDSALSNANIDALITLKETNSGGDNIAFDATINEDKEIITINPTANLGSEQVVYVAIGTTVEDTFDNAITASNITFTAADSIAPTVTFSPLNSATAVAVSSNITLTFSEAIRNINDSAIDDTNVDALIILKDTDVDGDPISFEATIDGTKKIITINPNVDFSSEQTVYVAIGETVEDSDNNMTTAVNAVFVTADIYSPTSTFNPKNGAENVSSDSNISIIFDEAVRNIDDSALTSSNVDTLITLKETNVGGDDIAFDATIDGAKKVITINPTSDFTSEQVIYVAIGTDFEDSSDNAILAASATITASDTTLPTATLSPVNGAIDIAGGSNVTITFSETVRLTDGSALTNSNVDALITLKTTNVSGSDIAFDATVSGDVITIDPTSDFTSGQKVYVAIGATVEDASDNAIAAVNGIFTIIDITDPTVQSFSPEDDAIDIPTVSNLIITFSEIVDAESGDITLYKSDDTLIQTFDVTSDISGSGTDTITIDPTAVLDGLVAYYLKIDATAFDDEAGNSYAGIADKTTWSFTTGEPSIETLSPADNSIGVAVDSNLIIVFDKEVDAETGNITIKKASDDSTVETIDVTSGQITGTGTSVIVVNPSSDFSTETEYYVQIDTTAFDDAVLNSFAGITDTTTWNFKTLDSTAPTVSLFSPLDDAVDVDTAIELQITFDEAVNVGTGNIYVYKSDGTLVDTTSITSSGVSGSGTTALTIIPGYSYNCFGGLCFSGYLTLDEGESYYIKIDTTAIVDLSGNSYAGITDSTTWSFTTVGAPTCPTIANAATYNVYPTCGVVTCNTGYTLTGGACVLTASSVSTNGSANVSPNSIGVGQIDMSIPMHESKPIGAIKPAGTNILMHIKSNAGFSAQVSKTLTIQNHDLKILNLNTLTKKIIVEIKSESRIVELAVGEIKDIDLDGDGINDIKLSYNDLLVNRIDLTVEQLNFDNKE